MENAFVCYEKWALSCRGLRSCNPENNLLLASSGSPPRSGALGPMGPGKGSPNLAEGRHPGCWRLARSASGGLLREGQGRVGSAPGPPPTAAPPAPAPIPTLQCFPNSLSRLGAFKNKAKHPCLSPGGACGKCARVPSGHPTRGRISVDTSWGMHLSTLGQRGHPTSPCKWGDRGPREGRQKESDVEPHLGARPWGRCGRKPRTPARVGPAPKIHPLPGPCHREGQSPEPQGPPQARATPSERQLPCR